MDILYSRNGFNKIDIFTFAYNQLSIAIRLVTIVRLNL